MKKMHRTNIILTWVFSIILSLMSFLTKEGKEPVYATVMMFGASIAATILYFIKMNDIVKGILLMDLIAIADLMLSVLEGGNNRTFMVGLIVLGIASLYFEPKIIIGPLASFMTCAIVACIINPEYITGKTDDNSLSFFYLLVYVALGICLYKSTQIGKKLVNLSEQRRISAEEKEKQIKQKEEESKQVSTRLTELIDSSYKDMELLNREADDVGHATSQMSDVVEETTKSIGVVNEKIIDSTKKLKITKILHSI